MTQLETIEELPQLEEALESIQHNESGEMDMRLQGVVPGAINEEFQNVERSSVCNMSSCRLSLLLVLLLSSAMALFLRDFPKPSMCYKTELSCNCLIYHGVPEAKDFAEFVNHPCDESSTLTLQNSSHKYVKKCVKDCKETCEMLALNNSGLYRKLVCREIQNVQKYLGYLYYRSNNQCTWKPLDLKLEVCCDKGEDYNCHPDNGYI